VLHHAELLHLSQTFEARKASLCEALLKNDVAIEQACDMVTACFTCHVLICEDLYLAQRIFPETLVSSSMSMSVLRQVRTSLPAPQLTWYT
jgi:hypothetical protein